MKKPIGTKNRPAMSCAIYTRISSDPKGLALGVTRQEEDCRRLAEQLGWEVGEVYTDNDISASKGLVRPHFERMKKDVSSGLRDGILVYNIDRLTRRLSELATFLDWRAELGIPFATTEGDNTETANGVFMLQVKGAMAQQEAERISERVRRAFEQRRVSGLHSSGGPRPFGFADSSGRSELVWHEVEGIRRGAALLLEGGTLGQVARDWEALGLQPVSAKKFTRDLVRSVYQSARLAGLVTYQGEIVTEITDVEPILDRATWEAVQKAMKHGEPKENGSARKHVLSGFVFCALCGATMVASGADTNPEAAYRCVKDRQGCGGVKRNKRWLDNFMDAYVRVRLAEQDSVEADVDPEVGSTAEEVAVLEAKIAEARAKHVAGDMDSEDYYPTLRDLRARIKDLRGEEAAQVQVETKTAALLDPLQVWESGSLEARRALLGKLVQGIYVKPVGRIGRRPIPTDSIDVVRVEPETEVEAAG